MVRFIVEYYDCETPFPSWYAVPLEMCRGRLLCEDCQKDIGHMDSCEHIFHWTPEETVAIDKKESLEREGYKARIRKE